MIAEYHRCLMSIVIFAAVFITRNSLLRKDTKVVTRSLYNGKKKKNKKWSTKYTWHETQDWAIRTPLGTECLFLNGLRDLLIDISKGVITNKLRNVC